MRQKIIFLDADGTLVNYEGKLPASAVRAVQQARANGHRVYLCTGRSRAEVYPELWAIGLDGMIGGNGSYVEDHERVILHQTLTLDQCRRVVVWLIARGLAFYVESNSGLYAGPDFEVQAAPAVREYSRRKNGESGCLTVRQAFPDMIYDGDLYRDDVNKISFVLHRFQDHLDAAQAFPELKAGVWGGSGQTALFGDLGVPDIDKAHAVAVLLQALGADRADTIAFGDSNTDIPMLEYCAYGVAMGNGSPEIRQMADLVTDDVDQDGLWKAFDRLGLLTPEA